VKRFHSTLLLLLMTWVLTACQTMPGDVSSHELEMFTPQAAKQRIMNEVKVRWDVREDVAEYCAKAMKMGPDQAYFTRPLACAIWNRRAQECTIVTGAQTNHLALGHELRHCFEGHFHS
jgi:ABC-type dipeptide/oligopeptide/nickel transport system permease component